MEPMILLITQARMGSSRLPGKILKKIGRKSLLEVHLERLSNCKHVSRLLVATTENRRDNQICELLDSIGIEYYRGSEEDVLDRYYLTAEKYQPDYVIRVTSDCPLIDPVLVDDIAEKMISGSYDYISNTLEERYPDGQDIEIFTFHALKKAWSEANKTSEREHVTPYIKFNSDFHGSDMFKAMNFDCKKDYSNIRMTVDEQEDLILITKLIEALGSSATWEEYTLYMIKHNLTEINSNITRNEGYLKSKMMDNN